MFGDNFRRICYICRSFLLFFGPLVAGIGFSSNSYAELSYRGLIFPLFENKSWAKNETMSCFGSPVAGESDSPRKTVLVYLVEA